VLGAGDERALRVPPLLDAQGVTCRPPNTDEIDGVLADWRVEYCVEALGDERTSDLREMSRKLLRQLPGWVLLHDDRPVSYSSFTATTRGMVQVGGVYTPAELRGRGYGRAVVAGSLRDARKAGSRRSVLFTSRANTAAQRAYCALGYQAVGDFALLLFHDE
jgi:predicted GNAT family acetyltransferase